MPTQRQSLSLSRTTAALLISAVLGTIVAVPPMAAAREIENPRERLADILKDVTLRFATEGDSAGERFSFQVHPGSDSPLFLEVQRDGDRAAIMVRAEDSGLPLGYATGNLAVIISQRFPGRLEVFHGNEASLEADDDDGMEFVLAGLSSLGRTGTNIDVELLPSRIWEVLDSELPITGKEEHGLLVFTLYPKKERRLVLRIDPEASFPIRDLHWEHYEEDSVHIADIRVGEVPQRPFTAFKLEDVNKAGLYFKLLHRSHFFADDQSSEDLSKSSSRQTTFMNRIQELLTPLHEGMLAAHSDKRRAAAAQRFLSLFPEAKGKTAARADIGEFSDPGPWPDDILAFDFPAKDDNEIAFPENEDQTTTPIELGGYLPFVKARIDDEEAGYFMIDTGAERTVIRAEAANRMGLAWERSTDDIITESTGGEQETSRRAIESLKIGATTFHPDEILTADFSKFRSLKSIEIEGLIGRDILGLAPFTIDYSQKTLTFHRPEVFEPPEGAIATTTPWFGESPKYPATVIQIDGAGDSNGHEILCTIDTGMETALSLHQNFVDRHATAFESWPRRRGWVMGLSLARVSTRMAPPAGAVEMFGHASTIPSVTIGLPDESYAGTVGALALKDYRVTFDARNESIYLEPNPTPDPVAESIAAGWDATSRDLFGHTPLALACMANNTALVHELLEAGISPAGSKELSEAIFIGNASHARLLIEAGAEVDDKDGKALWAAAQGGQVAIVRMLLEAGAKVSSASESAFGAALRHGETEITRLLLEAGADFTLTRGDESIPALHLASAGGHSDTAKLLLDAGADVDARSKDGVTALWRAVVNGHTETAKMLLEHSPDLSVKDGGGNSLLHAAASLGHARLVELLLGAGLDPMVMNASNASPLIAAATGTGSPEVAALLIERGADPDSAWAGQNDFPALHFASYNGHDELAALLIERGADVNHTAGSETTSLHGAARSGQVEIVALLLDAGAAIDAVDADGKTPLATAADSGYILTFAQLGAPGAENEKKTAQELMAEGHTEGVEPDYPGTVALLLERGADPSLLPDDGAETLHSLAIDWHQIKNIRTLLERGLDPAKSPRPLGLAGLAGNTEIAELLIQHGANALDASEALDQAFLLAVKYGHLQTAQVLLEQGADARAVAHKSKMNAFHLAVRHEHEALFDLLLAAGADPNARDIDANAPLHLAASENRLESARVLLEAGANPSLKNAILMDPQTIAKYNSPKNENLVTLLEEATKSEGP